MPIYYIYRKENMNISNMFFLLLADRIIGQMLNFPGKRYYIYVYHMLGIVFSQ